MFCLHFPVLDTKTTICQLERVHGLSNALLEVKTYYFTYPTVEDLLYTLNNVFMNDGANFIDIHGCQGLRIAGMFNIDDFLLITPSVPEKVNILFDFVLGMIEVVHVEKQDDIAEMAVYSRLG